MITRNFPNRFALTNNKNDEEGPIFLLPKVRMRLQSVKEQTVQLLPFYPFRQESKLSVNSIP